MPEKKEKEEEEAKEFFLFPLSSSKYNNEIYKEEKTDSGLTLFPLIMQRFPQ